MAVQKLIEHLKQHKDAIIILGSEATKDTMKPIDLEEFEAKANKKSLRRNKEEFWNYFTENLYVNPYTARPNKAQYECTNLLELSLAKKVYNQGVDGTMTSRGCYDAIDFKGSTNTFVCQKAKCDGKIVGIEDFDGTIPKCPECGFDMRPSMLLAGENYDDALYDQIRQDLIDTHTLIAVGIDVKEQIFLDLIADFGDTKTMSAEDPENAKMLVVIHDKDLEFDFNEITFCEFLVKDEPGEAMERLVKLIRDSY